MYEGFLKNIERFFVTTIAYVTKNRKLCIVDNGNISETLTKVIRNRYYNQNYIDKSYINRLNGGIS